ncbi:MAG: hypothetical protein ACHQT8_05270, partial [Chlamydiales bacterium]
DPQGVVYLGDGGWAASTREPVKAAERWYLAKTLRANFVYFVSLQGATSLIQAIDSEGKIIDQLSFP